MEKIQIHQITGKSLGITPDKDGFYWAFPHRQITLKEHNIMMAKALLGMQIFYEGEINAQRLKDKYGI